MTILGRVDDNGLAEGQSYSFRTPRTGSVVALATPVTARAIPAHSGAPCPPHSRDDYDRVWAYETADEQARWDEAQREARDVSADRFEREDSRGEA